MTKQIRYIQIYLDIFRYIQIYLENLERDRKFQIYSEKTKYIQVNLENNELIQIILEQTTYIQVNLEQGRYIQVNLYQKYLNIPEKLPSYSGICRGPARQTELDFSQNLGMTNKIQMYLDLFRYIQNIIN